jgi:protein-S-isoprenylcysteine O-methyltransferase Ste14
MPDSVNEETRPQTGRKDWQIVIIQFVLIALILVSSYYEYSTLQNEIPLFLYSFSIVLMFTGIIGLVITVLTFKQRITPFPRPKPDVRLVQTGIYSVIRHPMYSFIMVFMLGYCLFFGAYGSLVFCSFLFLFFDYKIRKEEAYLTKQFPGYTDYCKKTKKLIPHIY